jgi:hypothetical protein
MAEERDPIQRNLAEAFHVPVGRYGADWSPSSPALKVISLDQGDYSIRTVCGFVTIFRDPMPEHLQHALRNLRVGESDLGDLSYGSGARYLIGLMNARTAAHLEERRRDK